MGKSKEEDKIEKIIRGLLKLPENRRCINCNSLGPQYVCTTFWTFVCTNCSGVHREFTHRVKSISMAKFSMEEVNALQAGGNEKARQIYFKTWDPHRNHFPDISNIHQIRDFVKHVYVFKRYSGETPPDLVPRSRNSGLCDPYEHRRGDSGEKSISRSKSIDRYSRHDEIRSPQHSRENSRYGGHVASPSRFDSIYSSYQVDDPRENSRYAGLRINSSSHEGKDGRFQVEDPSENSRYGGTRAGSSRFEGTNGRYQVDNTRLAGRATTQMFTTEDIKPRRRSPDRIQSTDMNSPTVYDVKEILGENSIALRVANCPRFADRRWNRHTTNAQQEGDYHNQRHKGRDHCQTSHRRTVSASTQDTAESISQASFSNAELKPKSGSVGSLLALADVPSPSDEPVQNPGPQTSQTNETNVDSKPPVEEKSCNAPPKNTLEFLLFELSTPAENTSSDQSGIPCDKTGASSSSTREPPTLELVPTLPSGSGDFSHVAKAHELTDERTLSAAAATTSDASQTGIPERSTDANTVKVTARNSVPDLLGDDSVPSTEEGGRMQYSSNQHLGHSDILALDRISATAQTSHPKEGMNNHPTTLYQAQLPQPNLGPTRETNSSLGMQPSRADTDIRGRKELPADLFAFPYQSSSMPASGWQTYPNIGMGFNMNYYPPQMQRPPYPNVAKSRNPFDTNDDTPQSHANKFATREFLQGGLTNMLTPSGMSHTSYYGSYRPGSAPIGPPNAYPPSVQHQPSCASAGAFMGQHSYYPRPTSTQGAGGFGGELGSMISLPSNQQIAYRYPAPADQSSYPMGGGNPFG